MSLNRIVIMGRMTANPELHHTNSGTAVTSFTLAVDRDFKNQNGEKEVDFIDCTAWRNNAEFVTKYFGKGRMAIVEGKLQFRSWKDKEGNNRRNAEVLVDSIYFGDTKNNVQKEDNDAPKDDFNALNERVNDFAEVEDNGDLPF